ncbi:Sec-independent protein translocase subunit TatA [Microbacterium stercoris]|uniref:Sec-independent protein translocase protein TatA n=1 Tax=Microbacterium stercoris TaxID=2820289 RepID=A0A939QIV4_9MICO|nr:Sec-independent protein translocase subunit TatA [Microbacterium stercoris]MBO3662487.1 Sec-independent protein translocase subunit TatA [Microbacterium stercoris]MBO3664479.1 Sec-independent protein translocase subunit TatA [Microbacterium stercoris]
MGNLTGWHLLILLAVILLLFGAARLPALARSLGQSARVFKSEVKQMKAEDEAGKPGTPAETQAPGYTLNGNPTDRLPGADEPHKPTQP